MARKVLVSEMTPQPLQPGQYRTVYSLTPEGEAVFHQFGSTYEEFDNGAGNQTTAIVEWPDGQVEEVPAGHIKFLS
jgi:hypothetical protein